MARLKKLKDYYLQIGILLGIIILIILIVTFSIKGIKTAKYHRTDEYKLTKLGYTVEEAKNIITYSDKDQLEVLLKHEYDENIDNFISCKFFLFNKLDNYLEYRKANSEVDYEEIVALVNVNRDKAYYFDTKETNTSLNEKMLVNKYYLLPKEYKANVVKVSSQYAYGENYMEESAYDAFKDLFKAGKDAGYTIVISDSYRTYEKQEKIWTNRKNSAGEEVADSYAARPGASDHETGYSVNLTDFNHPSASFSETDAYNWLINNCYSFGFIQRYPLGKDNITGFSFEAGHFRYVGVDVATEIHNLGITFDEYYAYYIEK